MCHRDWRRSTCRSTHNRAAYIWTTLHVNRTISSPFQKRARWFMLLLAAALVGCDEKTAQEPAKPESVQELHKNISGVYYSERDDATEILISYERVWNEAAVLFNLAQTALTITGGMKEHGLFPSTARVRYTIAIPLVDEYGNTAMERVVAVTFLSERLEAVNTSNKDFLPSKVLNLYEKVWHVHPLSSKIIRSYCLSEMGKYSEVFCKAEFK